MKNIFLILIILSGTFLFSSPAFPDSWKIYPECGEVTSFVIDAQRNCIWFVQNSGAQPGRLGKFDLSTEKPEYKAEGTMDGGIGFHTVQMEGNHLWLAGMTEGPNRGGLAMYDIPSGSLLLYRVANTAKDDITGMRKDNVRRITAEKGRVWIYDPSPYVNCALTCFNYMEQDQAKRWVRYTQSDQDKPQGKLKSDGLAAVIPSGGKDILISSYPDIWQTLDVQAGTFQTGEILPQRPAREQGIAASVGKGKEWKISCDAFSSHLEFLGLEGPFLWFTANVEVGAPKVEASKGMLICRDLSSKRCLAIRPELSDSWEGANDGLPDFPRCMDFDKEYLWFGGNRKLCRMNRRTMQFTHYNNSIIGNMLPMTPVIRQITVTPDTVWFATDVGLMKYVKSDVFPEVIGSSPEEGTKEAKIGNSVSVSFSVPMGQSTIRKDTIQLYVNGGLYPAEVSYVPQTRTAVLSVGNTLPSGMPCEIRLKSLVQAANGNPLEATRINFATAQ